VQPTQLSLMPEQLPAPPASLLDQLPEAPLAAAIAALAGLIAKTVTGGPGLPEVDDE
jgi:hypothetical protein